MKVKKTYITLFSSAGVGCFGFKMDNYDCIATNELIQRRMDVQKANNKCKYENGYICGDITTKEIKEQIYNEIKFWKKKENIKDVDVIIATPPCQGMSVANHKKTLDEINRNSLVVESIKFVQNVKPKFFIFENVSAFLKTACSDIDDVNKPISEAIFSNLGSFYNIDSRIINFKNYGSNSSRTRTLVIGVRNDLEQHVAPYELFPTYTKEKTLKEVIGGMKKLKDFYEIDNTDIYHFFRGYSEHMRPWIKNTRPNCSAFDNEQIEHKPHQIIDGKIVLNKNKNGDKYKRQNWDKVAPCIHTRNDQLASQNTVHPVDDRVFSIRELMLMMTIPKNFKWTCDDINDLNNLDASNKIKFYKKEEIKIRQSIGEAVPTTIFNSIACNISKVLDKPVLKLSDITSIIEDKELYKVENLSKFIKMNNEYTLSTLSTIVEMANSKRESNSAYYTDKLILSNIIGNLPTFTSNKIRILEPSVGCGNFLPILFKKYDNIETVEVDVVDIDSSSIELLKLLVYKMEVPSNFKINYIVSDFKEFEIVNKYDLILGNPPFTKVGKRNLSSYFIEKAISNSSNTVMIMPKNILNTDDYVVTRKKIENYKIERIIDFGEKGFKGVLVETVCLFINTKAKINTTVVKSITKNLEITQKQKYITNSKMPYWIIYRNDFYDEFNDNMKFNIFNVFRDRQITNSILSNSGTRVLKSRNLSDDGQSILSIDGYDSFVDNSHLDSLSVKKYMNSNVYITPNMTYKTRVGLLPKNCVVNGSLAILIPKDNIELSKEDMEFFSTKEYRWFLDIARNYQTRSINIDKTSVYFFGIKKGRE